MTRIALLFLGLATVAPAVGLAQVPLEWVLNPPLPCAADSVVLVLRGYWPIGDQDRLYDPFYVSSPDSFARAARTGPGSIVVRTVHRPDRTGNRGDFTGVPVGIGRLPAGAHRITIEHRRLVQTLDGALDSTIVERQYDFTVAAECSPVVVPMASLPTVREVSVTPSEPCAWEPLTVTVRGIFNDTCPRLLLAAPRDSAHADLVIRRFASFRNVGCFHFPQHWSAALALGLPAPGTHRVEASLVVLGYDYRWPPLDQERYLGVLDVAVAPTCGSLPERSALPFVTGIGVQRAGSCASSDAAPAGGGIPVAIAGVFPDGCRRVESVDLLPNPLAGATPRPPIVRVHVADDGCRGASCTAGEVPWCVETVLPALPAGAYALIAQVSAPGCDQMTPPADPATDAIVVTVPRSANAAGPGDGTVGVVPGGRSFDLSPVRPNPSAGPVGFSVSVGGPGEVGVSVYDVSGRRVRDLFRGRAEAGALQLVWDGRDSAGGRAPGGVYFVRVSSGGQTAVRSIVMLRSPD